MNIREFAAGIVTGALCGAAWVWWTHQTPERPVDPTQARLLRASQIASRYPLAVEQVFDWLGRCADEDRVVAACKAYGAGDAGLAEAVIVAGERKQQGHGV